MLSNISLRTRIFTLISVPLMVQLALFGAVAYLQNQAEDEARRAEISRKLADEVIELTRDILSIRSNFGVSDSIHLNPELGTKYKTLTESVEAHFEKLRALTQSNLELSRALNRSITSVHTAQQQMIEARREYKQAKRGQADGMSDKWLRLRDSSMTLSSEILSLGEAGKAIADASPEKQRKFREQVQSVLIAGGCVNIVLTLLLTALLTNSIISRLKIINDNSYRLVSNRPLNPPLSGRDEIATVDAIFHQMAGEIMKAASKEKAILESAYDCICSFDSTLRFVSSNAACENFFAVTDSDILSNNLTEYLDSDDAKRAREFIAQAMAGKLPKPIKISLRREDGQMLQVLWSGRWAAFEGNKGEFYSIFHDVTEQSRAEELRQEVVAMVTHDLRTPLMTVQTFLDMLSQGFYQDNPTTSDGQSKSQKHLAGAKRSCNRMMLLIRDLIDIEKIKSGMMTINPSQISAKEMFDNVIEESTAYANEMGVSLKVRPTKSMVTADEEMLQRVLNNLVANAIKFTPEGGAVTLSAHNSATTVTFSVSDEGPGLPPDMLKKVFDRFQQAPNQTARTKGGSGLGLTICQAIVHLHKGQIWAESAEGEGSQFFFTLPKA